MKEDLIMAGLVIVLTCGLLLLRYLLRGRKNNRSFCRLYLMRHLSDNNDLSTDDDFDKLPEIKLQVALSHVAQVRARKSRGNEIASTSKAFVNFTGVVVFALFSNILLMLHGVGW